MSSYPNFQANATVKVGKNIKVSTRPGIYLTPYHLLMGFSFPKYPNKEYQLFHQYLLWRYTSPSMPAYLLLHCHLLPAVASVEAVGSGGGEIGFSVMVIVSTPAALRDVSQTALLN